MMLHGLCVGEEAGARNLVFFRVKWLQATMKATSSVRRLRLGSFGSFYVFCNNACSCMRSSMRFLTLWCQIALEWLHDVTCRVLWGGSRSTKPCVFPYKVAAAAAACVILLSFAAEDRKSYWNGCIKAAKVICQQIFSILQLIIFLLKFLLKSASKSSFCLFGVEIQFLSSSTGK